MELTTDEAGITILDRGGNIVAVYSTRDEAAAFVRGYRYAGENGDERVEISRYVLEDVLVLLTGAAVDKGLTEETVAAIRQRLPERVKNGPPAPDWEAPGAGRTI